jgi:hypothetical protein
VATDLQDREPSIPKGFCADDREEVPDHQSQRHHDRYESGRLADANMPYWPANALERTAKLLLR